MVLKQEVLSLNFYRPLFVSPIVNFYVLGLIQSPAYIQIITYVWGEVLSLNF